MQRFMVKNNRKKKEKEEHADLMWFGQLPTSIGIGKRIFTIYQIRVT